jgi:tetraacyldisaccharide 4'-kinase
MKRLLLPLTLPYKWMSELDRKVTKPVKLQRPVISVGNITWGGTGKTPVVIGLAGELARQGLKIAVLTRGYFRSGKSKNSVIVSDGRNILAAASEAGDEAVLIAEKLAGCAVISGPDRVLSAQIASELFNPDLFVLDDGFQHWKLERNADIVCVNALNPFGNGFLIPAGILREGLPALGRADEIIITNSDIVRDDQVKDIEYAISECSDAKTYKVKYDASSVYRFLTKQPVSFDEFSGTVVAALSGVGENAGFRRMLEKRGLNVETHLRFRDHHWYDMENLKDIFGLNMPVFTTEKDAVRLAELAQNMPGNGLNRIFVVGSELTFINGDANWQSFAKKIRQYL